MRKMRGTAFRHRLLALSAALALGMASWPLGVQAAGIGLGATGLQVTGGVEGLDYEVDDAAGMVVVKTDTPLTISGSSSTHGVRVAPGVHADVTFSGVTITAPLPLDVATNLYGTASGSAATDGAQIQNKTSLHLTLADGSVNTLTAARVRCSPLTTGCATQTARGMPSSPSRAGCPGTVCWQTGPPSKRATLSI